MRLARPLALVVLALGVHCAAREPAPAPSRKVASALGWSEAVAPIRIRAGHTATLLGTGEILVAGGGGTPRSTELVQPFAARVTLGPELVEARREHTATMLLTGKVLLAGGRGDADSRTASAELYDPVTRTSTATGAMTKPRRGHLAVRLRSGRVLVVGGAGDTTNELFDPTTGTWTAAAARNTTNPEAVATLADGRVLVAAANGTTTTEIFDEASEIGGGAFSIVAPGLSQAESSRTLTRLHDGRVFSPYTAGCFSVGGPPICDTFSDIFTPKATPPGGPFPNQIAFGPQLAGRAGFTAIRAVSGEVLVIGGDPGPPVERYDGTGAGSVQNDGSLLAGHANATSTLLPGGDVLVIGGAQAAIDRRVAPGAWRTAGFTLKAPRERHAVARLHDGRVLVTGGDTYLAGGAATPLGNAEILDLAAGTSTAVGSNLAVRHEHAMTTLGSGKVLVTGGGTSSAEIYDPAAPAAAAFSALPPMATSRAGHASVLLPSGKVLVIGGAAEPSAELFDPDAGTFTALPKPLGPTGVASAVVMPNGLVLVVGGSFAQIFDPLTSTFRATAPPGAARDGRTARLTVGGKVFVFGGETLAAELFDPASESWSYTSSQDTTQPQVVIDRRWTPLPDGRIVASGGRYAIESPATTRLVFDPIAHPTGTFLALPSSPRPVYLEAATLAGTGEAIQVGGNPCYNVCVADSSTTISVYGDGAPAAARPTIGELPAAVTAGTKVRIVGTGFANGAEASDGRRGSSATNHPTAFWVSDIGDAVIPATILDFTDTTATWLVPTTALYGHGLLFVAAGGVLSRGRSVAISPALAATGCANDAQCKTGFCVDGVCCDRRCDASCEGCSAARKTSGDDGVCGAVPPGRDITGRCLLTLGQACTTKAECGPNFCSRDGVCCDSACEGQCLSCTQAGKAGRCSAINEGACGAACDGDHTLKQVGVPDVDCAPYKCGGPQCNQTCASVRDCVAPSVCNEAGSCVPGVSPSPGSDAVCGCRIVGASRGGDRPLGGVLAVVLGLLLSARRARRGARP